MVDHRAAGTAAREAWRRFYTLTVEPLAELVSDQLFRGLGASGSASTCAAPGRPTVVTLSRAVNSLQSACIELAQAREVVGL